MIDYQERVETSLRPLEGLVMERARVMALAVMMGAREVGRGFGKERSTQTTIKADQTIVTPVDIASQEVMLRILRRKLPEAIISAEEKPQGEKVDNITGVNSGEIIYVDPLDGTAPFARGIPVSAVTAADAGSGAVCIPGAKYLWIGQRDTGVWRMSIDGNHVPIVTSLTRVGVSDGGSRKPYGFIDMTSRATTVDRLSTVLLGLPAIRGNWSIGCGCNVGNGTWVANGSAEFAILIAKGGFWDFNGHRLVQFAGGYACDQYGDSITPNSEFGLAVATVELRDKLLELSLRAFDGYQGFAPKK